MITEPFLSATPKDSTILKKNETTFSNATFLSPNTTKEGIANTTEPALKATQVQYAFGITSCIFLLLFVAVLVLLFDYAFSRSRDMEALDMIHIQNHRGNVIVT